MITLRYKVRLMMLGLRHRLDELDLLLSMFSNDEINVDDMEHCKYLRQCLDSGVECEDMSISFILKVCML